MLVSEYSDLRFSIAMKDGFPVINFYTRISGAPKCENDVWKQIGQYDLPLDNFLKHTCVHLGRSLPISAQPRISVTFDFMGDIHVQDGRYMYGHVKNI